MLLAGRVRGKNDRTDDVDEPRLLASLGKRVDIEDNRSTLNVKILCYVFAVNVEM